MDGIDLKAEREWKEIEAKAKAWHKQHHPNEDFDSLDYSRRDYFYKIGRNQLAAEERLSGYYKGRKIPDGMGGDPKAIEDWWEGEERKKREAEEKAKQPTFPQGVKLPEDGEIVQVLMQENMARAFEKRILKANGMHLAGPVIFSEDDVPSYIIGIDNLRR